MTKSQKSNIIDQKSESDNESDNTESNKMDSDSDMSDDELVESEQIDHINTDSDKEASDEETNEDSNPEDDNDDEDDSLDDNVEIDDEDKEIRSDSDKDYDSDNNNDNCVYKYADNKSDSGSEIDDIEEIYDDETQETSKYVSKEDRITKPRMTKYERVRLEQDRMKQLSGGAKPMIKDVQNLSIKEIVQLELKHNVIPLIIERPLPNGKTERWYTSELEH